jgi:pentatricopeptide repeat protein
MNFTRFHLGYVKNNIPEKALDLFEQMPFNPDDFIIVIIFSACAQSSTDRAKKIGKELLRQMSKTYRDNHVYNAAINMLMNHNEVSEAEKVFNMIKQKDSISYGTLMHGFNKNNEPLKCLNLFGEMKSQHIVPSEITFDILIRACALIGILSICESIIVQIPPHICSSPRIANNLIYMWVRVDC